MPNWTENKILFKSEDDCKKFTNVILDEKGNVDFGKIIPKPVYCDVTRSPARKRDGIDAVFYLSRAGLGRDYRSIIRDADEKEIAGLISNVYRNDAKHAKYAAGVIVTLMCEDEPFPHDEDGDILKEWKENKPYVFENPSSIEDESGTWFIPEDVAKDDTLMASYLNGRAVTYLLAVHGAANWYDWSVRNWGVKWNACETYAYDDEVSFMTPWCEPDHEIIREAVRRAGVTCIWAYDEEQVTELFGYELFVNGELYDFNTHEGSQLTKDEVFFLADFFGTGDIITWDEANYCCVARYGDFYDEEEAEKVFDSLPAPENGAVWREWESI